MFLLGETEPFTLLYLLTFAADPISLDQCKDQSHCLMLLNGVFHKRVITSYQYIYLQWPHFNKPAVQ